MYDFKKESKAHYKRNNSDHGKNLETWRSTNRQWDYIICIACAGCGKALSKYDNIRGFAFCHNCREILFPDTVNPHESHCRSSPY